MATTYNLIGSYTVSSGTSTTYIEFANIPQTYTDLLLKLALRGYNNIGWNNSPILIRFNTLTGTYNNRNIFTSAGNSINPGYDSYQSENRGLFAGESAGNPVGANSFGNAEIYIPNYTNSVTKVLTSDAVYEGATQYNNMNLVAGKSDITAAITNLQIYTNQYNSYIMQYSTAYLYGIKNS